MLSEMLHFTKKSGCEEIAIEGRWVSNMLNLGIFCPKGTFASIMIKTHILRNED